MCVYSKLSFLTQSVRILALCEVFQSPLQYPLLTNDRLWRISLRGNSLSRGFSVFRQGHTRTGLTWWHGFMQPEMTTYRQKDGGKDWLHCSERLASNVAFEKAALFLLRGRQSRCVETSRDNHTSLSFCVGAVTVAYSCYTCLPRNLHLDAILDNWVYWWCNMCCAGPCRLLQRHIPFRRTQWKRI